MKQLQKQCVSKISTKNITLGISVTVRSSFTRENVIKMLNWLKDSNYHKEGFNGWNQYGSSCYHGITSEQLLNDIEKHCF